MSYVALKAKAAERVYLMVAGIAVDIKRLHEAASL